MTEHGCIFGDSLARGVILDENGKYVLTGGNFVALTAAKLQLAIDNFARFGATVFKGSKLLEKHADVSEYSFVALEFGGNDSDFDWQAISETPDAQHLPKTPLEAFCKEYARLIREVIERGGKPVVLNLPPLDENRYFETISKGKNAANILKWLGGSTKYIYNFHERYNLAVSRLAAEQRIPLIDIRSAFLYERHYAGYLCDDGIHLNEKGHKLAADAIVAATAR